MLTILLGIDKNQEIDKEYFKQLEMEIFNYSIKDSIKRNIVPTWNIILRKIYINKARSLYINILPGSYVNNKRLFNRMKNKEFTPKELVNMTTQELFPENWKHLIDEKDRRNKVLYETKKEAMTDQFKCRKCKSSRKIDYHPKQTVFLLVTDKSVGFYDLDYECHGIGKIYEYSLFVCLYRVGFYNFFFHW